MAGVSVGGGGHGGKKSIDHEIPLVPFIDLLLCCVMFLLVTAVWNQLAQLEANQQIPGNPNPSDPPPDPGIQLYLQITGTGYAITSSAGERIDIPKNGEVYDMDALRTRLEERRASEPNRHDLIVAPEDGVMYEDVIAAMDMAIAQGFTDVSLSDGAAL